MTELRKSQDELQAGIGHACRVAETGKPRWSLTSPVRLVLSCVAGRAFAGPTSGLTPFPVLFATVPNPPRRKRLGKRVLGLI